LPSAFLTGAVGVIGHFGGSLTHALVRVLVSNPAPQHVLVSNPDPQQLTML